MKHTGEYLFSKDTKGSAVVEATILLPIICMVFAALILLSMYLPGRAVLQRATQYAAYGLAAEKSDSSIDFSASGYNFSSSYGNVYAEMFSNEIDSKEVLAVVKDFCDNAIIVNSDSVSVECGITNYIIYKEVYVTATQSIKSPVNLSFVGFPETIDLTVTSTAVVTNGDEFVRNMDIAADFITYLADKMGIDLSAAMGKIQKVMDYINGK